MSWRAISRRLLPYALVAAGGFLLAYLFVAFVVFPPQIVPDDAKIPQVVGLLFDEAVTRLEEWGMVDTFRKVYPDADRLYTYWDYRAGDFHQHRGMRIDLMLVSKPLAEHVTWGLVDRNARKGKLPSDHAPLVIDFDFAPA